MKIYNEYLTLLTKNKREYVTITPQVRAAVQKSGIRDGLILIWSLHANAGVYVNDEEQGLTQDLDDWLEKLAPFREDYKHGRTAESNASAHLKSVLTGGQAVLPLTDGRLDFGPWEQVIYAEFDGQRPKRVLIKVMGE